MNLSDAPAVALTFILVCVIFVAGFLVVNGIRDSQYVAGCNSTNHTGCSSAELGAITSTDNVSTGLTNIVSYAPTWGVIIGVAVLLGIVISGFMFARGQGYL